MLVAIDISKSCACSLKLLAFSNLQAGADVNLKGPSGQPVLFNAVDDGLTDIVKFLLEAGADPNIHDGVIMACLCLLFTFML